jgi:uncharacterized 2Fe-2S/4Fe-4S cluster protein (DUF4445 family)
VALLLDMGVIDSTGRFTSHSAIGNVGGAFGNYIRPQSARRIGLLPDVPVERIQSVGNAASSGAQLILLSSRCRKFAADLARKIQYVEIAHDPEFQTTFADSIPF